MHDDEIKKHLERMLEIFGDSLPNVEHEPNRFKYYVKLYRLITKNSIN